jgi:hypothetical protein
MSLYSSDITLLPRPARDIFSIGNESTRATLPDFATVSELSLFNKRHFNWYISIPSMYDQTTFTVSLGYIMVAVVGLTMAMKIYQGKFWLIRIIQKPTGVLTVVSHFSALESSSSFADFRYMSQILFLLSCS